MPIVKPFSCSKVDTGAEVAHANQFPPFIILEGRTNIHKFHVCYHYILAKADRETPIRH